MCKFPYKNMCKVPWHWDLTAPKRCCGTSLLLTIAGCLEASPRRALHSGGVAVAGGDGLCGALEVGCGQARGHIHRCDRGARAIICTRHSSSSVHRLGSTSAFAGGACALPDSRPPNDPACQHHTGRHIRIQPCIADGGGTGMFNTAASREALGSSRKLADEPHSAPGTYCCLLHATCSTWEAAHLAGLCGSAPGAAAGACPSLRSRQPGSIYLRQHTVSLVNCKHMKQQHCQNLLSALPAGCGWEVPGEGLTDLGASRTSNKSSALLQLASCKTGRRVRQFLGGQARQAP